MPTVEYLYTDADTNDDYFTTVELRVAPIGVDRCLVNVESVTINRIVVYLGTKTGVELCGDGFDDLCKAKATQLREKFDKWQTQDLYEAWKKQSCIEAA